MNVQNYQVTVKEMPDQIIFLHKVQPGGADKSYGIEAGRLAGLPPTVIQRAKQVMTQIEQHSKIAVGLRRSGGDAVPETVQEKVGKYGRKARRSRDPIDQLDMFNGSGF